MFLIRSYNERELSLLFLQPELLLSAGHYKERTYLMISLFLPRSLKYFGLAEEKGWMDKRGG